MFFVNPASKTVQRTRQHESDLEIRKPEDLEPFSSGDLTKFYNKAVPSAPIQKSVNKATAISRTFPVLDSLAKHGEEIKDEWGSLDDWAPERRPLGIIPEPVETSEQEEEPVATATAGKKKNVKKSATKAAAKKAGPGRSPGLAGATLVRVGEENPCRGGGIRAKAWDMVPKGGIKYETFVEKGGDTAALAFNIRTGRTKVERAGK